VLGWIWSYRAKPNPAAVPGAIRAVSSLGTFKDPETAGVYVGFLAGVLAANPARAEELALKAIPTAVEDQWVIVRAVAYSGLPEWKSLLGKLGARMPARRAMIEKYVSGKLPVLDSMAFAEEPKFLEKAWNFVRVDKYFDAEKPDAKPRLLEPNPDLLDTLWGYYFANGSYAPLARIIALLPLSKEDNSPDKLTVGSMAKYTLAINATRDAALLQTLRWALPQQSGDTATILNDVIEAAETVETSRIRKEAVAALKELERKGPGFKRQVAWWGQVGEGAISLGCLGAAVAGQAALGIPCVVGGAVSSAALRYWAAQ
jgi:hypothetical protein